MRFTTTDIERTIDAIDASDGVPVVLGGETTMLAQRPYLRPKTQAETPRTKDSNGVPVVVHHEDADVCVGLWCAA